MEREKKIWKPVPTPCKLSFSSSPPVMAEFISCNSFIILAVFYLLPAHTHKHIWGSVCVYCTSTHFRPLLSTYSLQNEMLLLHAIVSLLLFVSIFDSYDLIKVHCIYIVYIIPQCRHLLSVFTLHLFDNEHTNHLKHLTGPFF